MIVAAGVFMSTLDSSMVNIALPTIMQDFHSPMAATEWVVLIYLLTITATLLFWGHLGDRFGRGRIYGAGMLIFALGSLACTVSTTLFLLIASRFSQALGAAMLMATGPAIVKDSFPREQLGRTMGLIGVAVSLGLMSGPSLGGFLIEYFSWRSMFFLTVPIGLIFSFLAVRFIPMTKPDSDGAIDWAGAATWATALLLITVTLTHLTDAIWSPTTTMLLFLCGTGLMSFFIFIEKRNPHPLLPLELFKSRYFSMGIVSAVLSFTTLFAAIMLMPFYLDRLRELSPSMTGLVMMAVPASIMLLSPLAGWLADHFEKRLIATTGLIISSAAVLLLSATAADSSISAIAIRLALIGGGQALFLSPNSAAVLGSTIARRAGSAAALLATARNLGMLLGIAMATLLFTVIFSSQTGGLDMKDFRPENAAQFTTAFEGALQIAAMIGFLGALASWCRGGGTAE
jgi:EmrB/QacA subfamily drug resistance transporter